jgi:hypothetical protein
MMEPLEAYLDAFETYRDHVENLLELTVDLSQLDESALLVVGDRNLLYALSYLAGPPISADDLAILADTSLSPGRLVADPTAARRVVSTVLLGLDRHRFVWMSEDREPTAAERESAIVATAALMASRRVVTRRANESKDLQELAVRQRLREAGLAEVRTRPVPTMMTAPDPGQFCGESLFGDRKADIIVRLWDGRAMPIECKVSNSATNSVKRLNNDAAAKAAAWIKDFGVVQTVPAAVLAGVYKRHNLENAQERGLTIFWAHDLDALAAFVSASRRS